MKQISKRVTSLSICILLLVNYLCFYVYAAEDVEPYYYYSQNNKQTASVLKNPISISPKTAVIDDNSGTMLDAANSNNYNKNVVEMKPNGTVTYTFDVPKEGAYYIGIDYFIPNKEMSELIFSLTINGEFQFYDSRNLILENVWKDLSNEYLKDDLGNDLYPEPERVYRWQNKQLNSTIYNLSYPYLFNFKAGTNAISITNNEVGYILGDITISGKIEEKNFEQYKQYLPASDEVTATPIVIQAEKYSEKSKSYIRGAKGTEHNVTPYDPVIKQISNLSGRVWAKPNEGVSYNFTIDKTGIYYITFKYNQDYKDNMASFKQVLIDDSFLCDELRNYPFNFTGNKIKNDTLNINGENIPIYFEAGEHKITLISTAQPVYETYENLLQVINKANDIALQIKVITGNKADKNRDWGIDEYIPSLSQDLRDCADLIMLEYSKLLSMSSKKNASLISNLKVASIRLTDFSDDLNYLVNNLDQFTQSSSSVTEYISLVLPELLEQPVMIDQITISTSVTDVEAPSKGFFYNATQEVKKFFLSFFIKTEAPVIEGVETLDIWANRSAAHLDVLKEMSKNFEISNNVKVNLSLMPDEQKLLLAVSSGSAPDAVIGMSNYRPFDFAMRGAMYDMRKFEDFGESIKSFHPEMLIPFIIGESCYAIPETANFQVMFYRKDIMQALQLKIPQTWDDVISILPTLSRFGMDFNTMIANVGGTKHFGATIPFIQQFEGKIYSNDGTKVELGDPKTVEAFKLMTDLYTKYSLPENVPNFFNNFKKSITPIGISDISTYILLKNAAPEIAGQWAIAPSVGVRGNDGNINRFQASVSSCNGIMRDAENPDLAWKFLRWYMSDETQINYANHLQLRYGPEYIWNTANMTALSKSSTFSTNDMKIITDQLNQTKEIPRNPAYFAVERELSNAWNSTVFDGVSPRTALDQAITRSNREITKKLKEFGYLDNSGKIINEFTMATAETVERWKNE